MFNKQKPTFLDYMNGSCKFNLITAIDFTATNGDPGVTGTLYYVDFKGDEMNECEQAIASLGSIIAKYDCDQKFLQ